MALRLGPQHAAILADRATSLELAAAELCRFRDQEPELAAACGVELSALEAEGLVRGGAPRRISSMASQAAQSGREAQLDPADVASLARLETVIHLGNARIGAQVAAIDASGSPIGSIGDMIGLATGVVGLFKSIF